MKGRNTTPYMVRLPDEVAEWLKSRANGKSVGVYIKDMITRAYEKRSKPSDYTTNPVSASDYTTPAPTVYNPSIHKAGDRVMVWKGKRLVETVVPRVDAGGSVIPEYE